MRALFLRLGHEDDGSHPLEFALLGGGVVIALVQPYLVVAAFYRLADFINLFVSQLALLF